MISTSSWRAGAATDPGLQRANNEDRVFVNESAGIFLVVDGLGGQAAGEKAAEIAVHVIADRLTVSTGSPEKRVRDAIAAANNEIYQIARLHEEWRGMACVLTLALAQDDRVVVGHVGDSRLYLIWDGKLRKLTADHSPVGEREDQGEISEREAMSHPRRNQVFRDVGSRLRQAGDEDFIEVSSFHFRPDAAFLLCSDGLSDIVPSTEIAAIIETYDGDAESVSRRLVEAANDAGGKDNISVVFVAGPDFVGHESAAARRRHAITRPRRSRWRAARNRALWLAAGMLIGAASWAFVSRTSPARAPASRRITLEASDPHAIANALGLAQPGDTIEVPPGEYAGPIELPDDINLISSKPGAAVIRPEPAAVEDSGIGIIARGIHRGRISGFRIGSGPGASLSTGILVDGAGIEIDDVEISGADDCGILIVKGSDPVIHASNVHDNPGCGVWIGDGSSPRLLGNRISANGMAQGAPRPGIEIHTPASPVIERNIITGNGVPNLEDEIRRTNVTAEAKQ